MELTLNNVAHFVKRAYLLREQKDDKGALDIAKQCYTAFPQQADVQALWALMQFDKKQYQAAETAINTAIAIDPNNSDYFYISGVIHKAQRHSEAAEFALLRCLQLNDKQVNAYFSLGSLFEKQKRYPKAIQMFSKVVKLNPEHAKAHYNLGVIYQVQNKLDDAIHYYEKAYQFMPDDLGLLSNLGAALTMDGQHLKAISLFERALELSSDYVPAISNLGGTYIELNELQKAEKLLRRSLAINPKLATNWRNLTLCRHYEVLNDPDLVKILELIEEKISMEESIHYDFALGKIYHDCQDYKTAFTYYQKANQLQDKKVTFKPEVFASHIQKIIQQDKFFPKDHFHFENQNELQPLIIVGHSRSGKSLLESLLKQNPKIMAQGELGISNRVDDIPLDLRPQGKYPYWLETLTQEQATFLRNSYLQRLMRNCKKTTEYLIDTMPGNFMYLGLIRVLFPQAKIIYCQREALDTCTLLYFKYFIQGHAYSYDLEKLASFYQQQILLMEYWQQTFAEPMITVDYDSLVKAPEKILSTINVALGYNKDFHFDCSMIHDNEVGIFKHYRNQLAPLENALNARFDIPEGIDDDAVNLNETLVKAQYHFNLGELDAAQKLCQTIIAEDSCHIGALHLLGLIYFTLEEYNQAIQHFETALENAPANLQLHIDCAACWKRVGNQQQADKHLKIAEDLKGGKMPQQQWVLDEQTKTLLLSAFNEIPRVIKEFEYKLWIENTVSESLDTDRPIVPYSHIQQARAWHGILKNMALAEHVLKQSKQPLLILDVGCCSSYLYPFLEAYCQTNPNKQFVYWGLDYREEMIRTMMDVKGNVMPAAFVVQDATSTLPFRDNFFDYIVNIEMIPHLTIEEGRQLLAQLYSALNPQGFLVIATSYQSQYPGMMQSVPTEQFARMLYENGFEIIERRGSQANFEQLSEHISNEHKPLVKSLLTVHSPEMVAAIISPLYPEFSEQTTYLCKVR